jgi:DNA polymerase I
MSNSNERLYLLDGMALAYRAYYSMITRPLRNSRGENTSAIYGFATTLMKILADDHPEHIAVAFDTKQPTFRHVAYPQYKANREAMPEDMVPQLAKLKDIVRAFNTPVIELPGFEADDIMGTLARRAEAEGVRTFLVTGDKDMMQLITDRVRILRPGKSASEMEEVDERGVHDKFGVTPDRVIDVLALMGDKTDNVPGVSGIGEKTAIPLVQKFGSVESIYEALDQIPQKGVREKLARDREMAMLSKRLVTIDTAVPLDVNFHELRAQAPDLPALLRLFEEFEFKSLGERARKIWAMHQGEAAAEPVASIAPPLPPPSDAAPRPHATDISTNKHTYHCVTTAEALKALCATLAASKVIAFDTETTSTNPLQAKLVGCSFATSPGEAWYVPVKVSASGDGSGLFAAEDAGGGFNNTAGALDLQLVLGLLKPVLENPTIRKVGQNAKYDILVLRRHGIDVRGLVFDTMVAGYILRADAQHNLDALALEAFNYTMVSYEDLTGTGRNQKPITQVPLEKLADYAAEDADFTLQLFHHQQPLLSAQGLEELCTSIEFPLIEVLCEMEFNGVRLDTTKLQGMSKEIDRLLTSLVNDIHKHAGGPFNINSTQQLGDVLFNKLGLPPMKKTKTGFSTDVGVLEALQGQHPIIDALLEYRQMNKLKSTYVDALPTLIDPLTGRIHTSYNQTVAATGRLSSSDPNLQNIPIRTEMGRQIREAFVPRDGGMRILSADYSQIELRVMAHVCSDPGLMEAFLNDEDIHATTAAKVFGVDQKDVTKEMRRKAKEVNFGIMYGIGPFGLGNRLGISQNEARDIITRYFERFPKVKEYIGDTIGSARSTGYVQTLRGRRRYLPDITSKNQNIRSNAERQAINMPIQGTAADMIKLAMIAIHRGLPSEGLHGRMLLQVHDELVFEIPEGEGEKSSAFIIQAMQTAMPLCVPVKVEVGIGRNWLEAH